MPDQDNIEPQEPSPLDLRFIAMRSEFDEKREQDRKEALKSYTKLSDENKARGSAARLALRERLDSVDNGFQEAQKARTLRAIVEQARLDTIEDAALQAKKERAELTLEVNATRQEVEEVAADAGDDEDPFVPFKVEPLQQPLSRFQPTISVDSNGSTQNSVKIAVGSWLSSSGSVEAVETDNLGSSSAVYIVATRDSATSAASLTIAAQSSAPLDSELDLKRLLCVLTYDGTSLTAIIRHQVGDIVDAGAAANTSDAQNRWYSVGTTGEQEYTDYSPFSNEPDGTVHTVNGLPFDDTPFILASGRYWSCVLLVTTLSNFQGGTAGTGHVLVHRQKCIPV